MLSKFRTRLGVLVRRRQGGQAARIPTTSNPRPSAFEALERRSLMSFTVTPTVETDPVPHSGDAADDAAVWVHPADASQSAIVGSDKDGGLAVYDLSGRQLQYVSIGEVNNVDLRYGFPLGGQSVDLVVASNRSTDLLAVYRIDPATRTLENVAARALTSNLGEVYGLAMYKSSASGKFYAYVTDRRDGRVEQWELFDDGAGRVDGRVVRTFDAGGTVEGMVADDETGALYAGEEAGGLWKYGAEPDAGTDRTLIDTTLAGGRLTADLEGLAIYYAADGGGYLLASNQGANEFMIYDRRTGAFIDRFQVVSGAIDGVNDTDGIDVSSAALGPLFPEGVFVAQDYSNSGGNQNFKLVSWGDIARRSTTPLTIDTTRDPRQSGPALPPPEPPAPTPPQAPSGLSAAASSSTQIKLTWSDVSGNEDGFRVERSTDGVSFDALATLPAGTISYTDSALAAGTTYHYRVAAFNAVGESGHSNVARVEFSAPAAPRSLAAAAASTSKIRLAWVDVSTNESGFVVERSANGGGSFARVATLSAGKNSYTDSGLAAGTTYHYRVKAVNVVGQSPYGNVAFATTQVTVVAAQSPWHYLDDGTDQGSAWRQPGFDDATWRVGAGELGYGDGDETTVVGYGPDSANKHITTYFRRSFDVADPSRISDLALKLKRDDGAVVYLNGVEVFRSNIPSGALSYTTPASGTVSSGESNWHSRTIDPALLLAGRNVLAVEVHQSGPDSTDVTFDLQLHATPTGTLPTAPADPSGLTAAAAPSRIDLAWADNSADETGFVVERSTDDGRTFQGLANVGAGTTRYSDHAVTAGQAYRYRVHAVKGAGRSSDSNTVLVDFSAPAAPAALTAVANSASSVTLNWADASDDERGFTVERSVDGLSFAVAATVGAGTTSHTDSGLASQTLYHYRVKAFNVVGDSGYSDVAAAVTEAVPPPPDPADPMPEPEPEPQADVAYSGPIVITAGGTYTGNWESLDPSVPAVTIRTTEPVVIENANVRGRYELIRAHSGAHVIVRNTRGYGMNPNVYGQTNGRFFYAEQPKNVVLVNNYLESTGGIKVLEYGGDYTAGNTIRVVGNRALNIDGRKSDGNGGYLDFNERTRVSDGVTETGYKIRQFVQLDKVQGVPGIEIAWNEVVNEPGKSRVEDNINIYKSGGTADSPILIHDNYVNGAYNVKPWETSYSDGAWDYDWGYAGGGILLGDGSSGVAHVKAYGNTVVSTTNYGIAIAAGHDMEFYDNRVVSSGLLADGRWIARQNVGVYVWDLYGAGSAGFYNNSARDNVVGWVKKPDGTRNDWWIPDASSFENNTSWADEITLATEAAELALWKARGAAAGVVVGAVTVL